jgi:hypothetical protein
MFSKYLPYLRHTTYRIYNVALRIWTAGYLVTGTTRSSHENDVALTGALLTMQGIAPMARYFEGYSPNNHAPQ